MLTAEQYARAKELMCDAHGCCVGCPLEYDRHDCSCDRFAIYHPAECVKLVELWWEENKHRYPNITEVRRNPNENDG